MNQEFKNIVFEERTEGQDYYTVKYLSNSSIKHFRRSPYHFYHHWFGPPIEPTPEMLFGTACHAAVLEPDKFAKDFVAVEGDGRTKEVKAIKEAHRSAGFKVLSQSDMNRVHAVKESLLSVPTFKYWLGHESAKVEQEAYWSEIFQYENIDAVPCKAKADLIVLGGYANIGIDIKTTMDARPAFFEREIYSRGYAHQAGFYAHAFGLEAFEIYAVETEPPYATAVYTFSSMLLKDLYDEMRTAVRSIAECNRKGYWPSYPDVKVKPRKSFSW
jgi:exodeoxyribonuclease VIII